MFFLLFYWIGLDFPITQVSDLAISTCLVQRRRCTSYGYQRLTAKAFIRRYGALAVPKSIGDCPTKNG